jgi:membrane-associated phospholipid phosphatase
MVAAACQGWLAGGGRNRIWAVRTARGIADALAYFAALAVVASATAGDGWAATADRAAFERVRAGRTPAGIAVARAVSALAEPAVAYPLLAAAGAHAARRDGWHRALWPCLTVASGATMRRWLSQAIARPRPPEEAWLIEPEGFSLPSKHTTLAALAVGAYMRSARVDGTPARAAPLVAAAGVGASRVCLGVHWPADVIAGWLFAEGWLRLVAALDPADLIRSAMTAPELRP